MMKFILSLGIPFVTIACFDMYSPQYMKDTVVKYKQIASIVVGALVYIIFAPLLSTLTAMVMSVIFGIAWSHYIKQTKLKANLVVHLNNPGDFS